MRLTRTVPRVAAALLIAVFLALAGPILWSGAATSSSQSPHAVTVGATAASDNIAVRAATQETADRTLALAENAWDILAPRFPTVPNEPVTIVVVEDPTEYERIQPAPMTRGFATFGGNSIYLLGTDLDQEVVTHELAHIMLGKNVRPGLAIPDWFNEGFAQHVSGSSGHDLEIFYSVASGRLLTMQELDRVDALTGPNRELATIEGLGIIDFLVQQYGEDALWDLVSHFSHARTFGQALLDTYGRSDLELSDDWLAYAADGYGILSLIGLQTVGTTVFGILALVALAVWITTKIRLRRRPYSPLDLSEWEILEAERAAPLLEGETPYDEPNGNPGSQVDHPAGSGNRPAGPIVDIEKL
ncbi:MAG: peptidase MA family metallohydrolase [Thermoleophilia bacterium]